MSVTETTEATAPPPDARVPRRPYPASVLVVAICAFFLPVAYSPAVAGATGPPKLPFLFVLAGAGLPRLVALLRDRERRAAACAALVLLAAAGIATAMSSTPLLTFTGAFDHLTGFLFVVALAGAWALSVGLHPDDRALVMRALVAAAVVNALLSALQVGSDLSAFRLGEAGGRNSGFLGNGVHLAALTSAAIPLAASVSRRRWVTVGAVASCGVAVEASGGRLGLGVAVLLVAVLCARLPRREAAIVALALVAGLIAGNALSRSAASTSATSRTTSVGIGRIDARLHTWGSARHAIAERPLVGAGPSRFQEATGKHRSRALAEAAHSPDEMFVDAHNIVVEYAVTTGLVGVSGLLAFLALALRRARGPFAWFAVGLLIHLLLEPQSIGTTPLVFIALGAADAQPARAWHRGVAASSILLASAALSLALVMVVGATYLRRARLTFDVSDARTADTMLSWWAEPATMRGTIHAYRSIAFRDREEEETRLAVWWRREAVERDPTDPSTWLRLGELMLVVDPVAAEDAYRGALRTNPWSGVAKRGLAVALGEQERYGEAVVLLEEALELEPKSKVAADLLQLARQADLDASSNPPGLAPAGDATR